MSKVNMFLRPADMARSGAVAGLAAHVDLRKRGRIAIVCRIIILAHAGRMALRAHKIPILVQLGPVQNIVVLDLLVRVEMEPAVTSLLFRPAVPGDRKRLNASIWKLDQVLL